MNPLEDVLADALRRWKRGYAQPANEDTAASHLDRLAEILGESLDLANLDVTWAVADRTTLSGRWPLQEGSSGPATALDSSEAPDGDTVSMEPYEVMTTRGVTSVRWIRIRRLDRGGALRLTTTRAPSGVEDTWPWLSDYVRGLIDTYTDVEFVLAREARAQAAHALLEATRSAHEVSNPLALRLKKAASRIRQIAMPDIADLVDARSLLAWVLQEAITHRLVLRTPWRSDAGEHGGSRPVSDVQDGLLAASTELAKINDPHRLGEAATRLEYTCLLACLRAVTAAKDPAVRQGDGLRDLLAEWLCMWRTGVDPMVSAEACDVTWRAATARFDEVLACVTPAQWPLKRPEPPDGPQAAEPAPKSDDAPPPDARQASKRAPPSPSHEVSSRTWLMLWFVSTILARLRDAHRSSPATLLFPERDLRVQVAHVLCETLRHEWLGDEPDYAFLARPYAEALRGLVEYHAHVVLDVPLEFELHHALHELAREATEARGAVHAGQLLHVLDVYIGGQFLLDVRVGAEDNSPPSAAPGQASHARTTAPTDTPQSPNTRPLPTLADRIVGRRAVDGVAAARATECRQAYAVAAVFHDIGHLLFVADPGGDNGLSRGDPELYADVAHAAGSLRDVAGHWARRAATELATPHFVSEVEDPELADGLRAAARDANPEHGILGAYYLARVTRGLTSQHGELRRRAVRAVLLHGASSAPVDVVRDPVAAVLLLCNELFDWDATRARVASRASVSHWFHAMGADVPAYEPRHRRLWLYGIKLTYPVTNGMGQVVAEVPGRLRVYMDLQPPERLDVATHAVWLVKAWRLARLVPRAHHAWDPELEIRSQVRDDLLSLGLDTHTLLERLVPELPPPFRADLVHWLTSNVKQVQGRDERLRIRAGSAFGHDPRPHLAQIDQLARRVLEREVVHRLERRAAGLPKPVAP